MQPSRWRYTVPLRLRSLFRRGKVEQDLDDELQFHLEREVAQRVAGGMDATEARRRAMRELAVLERSKEQCRDTRRVGLVEDLGKDLAFAARLLRKAPVFATAAIATIALGIGAATAIFSVTHAVLLRPLPYRHAGRLVLADDLLSNAYFYDLRNGTTPAFADMAAVMVYRAVVPREDGTAERISKGWITTNFFGMLGARVVLGRDFTAADGRPQGQVPPPFPWPQGSVAVLSYDYFVRRYGANPAVLGQTMPGPEGSPGPRIVGILEPGFRLYLPDRPGPQPSPDVWIPNNRGYDASNRGGLMLGVVGIRKPGVSLAAAQSQIDRVASTWESGHPPVRVDDWHNALVAQFRPALLALLGAVIFLLLIACSNVAGLLLVRAAQRQRELAVRAALGARGGRLARQMLAEALLLCGLGTVLGVGLAWLGIRELLTLAPPNLPRLATTSIDGRVLLFAALSGLAEAAFIGGLPGWRAARPDLLQILRAAGRSAAGPTLRWLRPGVVIAEVALSFVLLAGSGLMFRSFLELRRIDPGFRPQGLLTFLAVGDARGFTQPERRMAFLRELQRTLRAIPGVLDTGAALALPLHQGGPPHATPWSLDGLAPDPGRAADLPTVLPGYFETIGARLLEGRFFTEADNAAARSLAVIDRSMAEAAFPGRSPLGKRICIYIPDPTWLEIVGVVAHQRLHSLSDPGAGQVYMMDGFWGIGISRHWALRTRGDPAKYAAAVRAAVARFAPGRLAVTEIETMETSVSQAQASTRFHLLLIGIFAALAVLLAGLGLYGVLSGTVGSRTAEIGIRMAIGAHPGGIFRLVIAQGLALSGAGILIGLFAAAILTRAMSSMLTGVRPGDPATLAAMTLLFLLLSAAACWLPARRAANLDPVAALREG